MRPGHAGLGLNDADEQQGEPAQDDVGADAFFEPVVDRPQVDGLLHVAPAALDFQELLVAQGDVLGAEVGVTAAKEVLAVEVGLGFRHRTDRPARPVMLAADPLTWLRLLILDHHPHLRTATPALCRPVRRARKRLIRLCADHPHTADLITAWSKIRALAAPT
ncbi:hypothetical protein [Microbispora sp. NBC_01389]|uniref:hypothetical protein n=1 Tax=Microbispora sp. NBC_01389 TaxID=2903584 RepID=UPI003243C245